MSAEPETYTSVEAAAVLGLHRSYVSQLCKAGSLAAEMVRIPHGQRRSPCWSIDGDSVRGYYAQQKAPLRVWNIYPGRATRRRTPRPYLDAVCALYEMTPDALLATGRGQLEVEARRVLSYLLYTDAGMAMGDVARLTRRDHSTAHNAIRRATEQPTDEVTWAIGECRRLVAQKTERKEKAG